MPLSKFICPDGTKTPVNQCLEACPFGERCASLPYLKKAADRRPWSGKPSTTQLINGTRLEYLKIVHDYSIDPREDMSFAILGTACHSGLDEYAGGAITEERLHDAVSHGKFDSYDPKTQTLTDYKTYGSFKVKRVLAHDTKELDLQVNHYRLLLEAAGHPVKKMFVEIIVRDGGLWWAKKSGVTKRFYRLPIKQLPDELVTAFFTEKAGALLSALETKTVPPLCTEEETWEGKRCLGYCPVMEHCKKIGDNPWLKK